MSPINKINDNYLTSHTIGDSLGSMNTNPGYICFICGVVVTLMMFFKKIASGIGEKVIGEDTIANLEIDEDLENYFRSLNKDDKDWWIAEESCCRDKM